MTGIKGEKQKLKSSVILILKSQFDENDLEIVCNITTLLVRPNSVRVNSKDLKSVAGILLEKFKSVSVRDTKHCY